MKLRAIPKCCTHTHSTGCVIRTLKQSLWQISAVKNSNSQENGVRILHEIETDRNGGLMKWKDQRCKTSIDSTKTLCHGNVKCKAFVVQKLLLAQTLHVKHRSISHRAYVHSNTVACMHGLCATDWLWPFSVAVAKSPFCPESINKKYAGIFAWPRHFIIKRQAQNVLHFESAKSSCDGLHVALHVCFQRFEAFCCWTTRRQP